jgi:hypothetical protein
MPRRNAARMNSERRGWLQDETRVRGVIPRSCFLRFRTPTPKQLANKSSNSRYNGKLRSLLRAAHHTAHMCPTTNFRTNVDVRGVTEVPPSCTCQKRHERPPPVRASMHTYPSTSRLHPSKHRLNPRMPNAFIRAVPHLLAIYICAR